MRKRSKISIALLLTALLLFVASITLVACGGDNAGQGGPMPGEHMPPEQPPLEGDAKTAALYLLEEAQNVYTVVKYRGNETQIDIPSAYNGKAITAIGESAFDGCAQITSVTIPNSVTKIGAYAFGHCAKLKEVAIPASVKSVGKCAFWGCRAISDVKYEGDVKGWCEIDFQGEDANPLDDVNRNTQAKADLYIGGSKLQGSLSIPDGTTKISAYAFVGFEDITSLQTPASVESIGERAFAECARLQSVVLGEGVESIGDYAFSACESLSSVDIAEGVSSIGVGAFFGCAQLGAISLPSSLSQIGSSAFFGCEELAEISFAGDVGQWCSIEFKSYDSNPLYTAKGEAKLNLAGEPVSGAVSIPDGVLTIGNFAFYGLLDLTEIVIPDSVVRIGARAFENCAELKTVKIGEKVTNIGSAAFRGCVGVEKVVISSLKAWCEMNFESLNVDYGDISSNPLKNAKVKALFLREEEQETEIAGEVVIPDETKRVSPYAFYGLNKITSVVIPDSVTSIGEYAFYGVTGLTELNTFATSIGKYAFYGATGLKEIDLSAESIGEAAFCGCKLLETVKLSKNLKSIGENAFLDCEALTTVKYDGSSAQWREISIGEGNNSLTKAKK